MLALFLLIFSLRLLKWDFFLVGGHGFDKALGVALDFLAKLFYVLNDQDRVVHVSLSVFEWRFYLC